MISRETFAAANGRILLPDAGFPELKGVSVDSRSVTKGDLFVPLKGERTDGHLYIGQALSRGAAAVLVTDDFAEENEKEIVSWPSSFGAAVSIVPDTLKALQDMALWHMKNAGEGICRIGITGSNGKTTTKELIGAVLSEHGSCFVSRGNLNSEIGLCMEALRIRGDEDYAVFEMGMNRRGEMDILVDIVDPDYAVITNIGTAHVGPLGSRDAIADEKKKIFSRFRGEQVGFVYEDESYYNQLVEGVPGRILLYGRKSINCILDVEDQGLNGSLVKCTGGDISFPLIGEYNRRNLYAAMALTKEIGIPFDTLRRALKKVKPLFGRGEVIRGEQTVILDCYNANYESMVESLRLLQSMPVSRKRIAVLGDMKELGEHSGETHSKLGQFLRNGGVDRLFLYGPEMKSAFSVVDDNEKQGTPQADWTESYEELARKVKETVGKGDLILIKGSRSMELERLLDVISEKGEDTE